MQLTLDKDRFLGIDWQFKDASTHSITIGAPSLPIPTGATTVDAFKIGVLDADQFQVTIKALDQFSDAKLISSPSIVTLDNMEAKYLSAQASLMRYSTLTSSGISTVRK